MNYDLSLVPTDDLIEALIARIDHGAIVTMQTRVNNTDNIEYMRWWVGNSHTIVGLLVDAQHAILKEMENRSTAPLEEGMG